MAPPKGSAAAPVPLPPLLAVSERPCVAGPDLLMMLVYAVK